VYQLGGVRVSIRGCPFTASQDIALTRRGCELFCGIAYEVPSDSGPRLLAWLFPILFLVSSIQYPEIGWKKYILLFTVLGNPILSNLSLLKELDNRRSSRPEETPRGGIFRAYAALLVYLWQVVAAFVEIIGGAPKPSGGMLGPAMLLSWLIPMVLLSNAVGGKASRKPDADLEERGEQQDSSNWSNITLLHRPDLYYSAANRDCWAPFLRLFLSASPVCIAFVTAFMVLYTKPTYFTCRHFVVIFVFTLWLLSFLITILLIRKRKYTDMSLWVFSLIKDALISCTIIALLISTSCGLFTSCFCLSGFWNYNHPRYYPFPTSQFADNIRLIYPVIISLCFIIQYSIYRSIRWIWREEFANWGVSSIFERIITLLIERVKKSWRIAIMLTVTLSGSIWKKGAGIRLGGRGRGGERQRRDRVSKTRWVSGQAGGRD
jgi:hypothetical protein